MNENKINRKNSNKFIKTLNFLVIIAFVVVAAFMGRIAIFKTASGVNLTEFVDKRGIKEGVNYATRGDIYDVWGNVIAQTLPSYNLFAVLDKEFSADIKDDKPKLHVTSPEVVADKVAPIIGMPKEEMLELLKVTAWQVEFAPYGNGLSQTKKDEIDALKLEGINFIENDSRKYPQGVFASHIVGYASYDAEKRQLVGQMGIESKLNDLLTGVNGNYRYQANDYGQKIKDAPEINVPAKNGEDVYLTIDSNIQRLLEQTVATVQEKHNPNWAVVVVADPKTGAVLGAAQSPTFDPNVKDINSYVNILVETEYEVGSVMKALTYAAAVDTGKYNGTQKVQTGRIVVDGFNINDWNKTGWGMMPLDDGLCQSSNTAIAHVVENVLTADEQKEYLKSFGFGKTTGIEMSGESVGTFALSTRAERITTGFGQGTTATVAQMVQAYSALANKGEMMQLHVVDRVVDTATGLDTYKHKPTVVGNPVSEGTANHITTLLKEGMSRDDCSSGQRFQMKTGNIAGKTGTAEVVDTVNGGYLYGSDSNYVYSFAGYAPAEDPQFVIYTSIALPQTEPARATTTMINSLTDNINQYLNVNQSGMNTGTADKGNSNIIRVDSFPSFLNKQKEEMIGYAQVIHAEQNIVFIGDGETVVNQNIEPGSQYINTQRIIVRTNGTTIALPNFAGWSRKDIEAYADMAGLVIDFQGEGYVVEQSLAEGTIIGEENRSITVRLVV